MTVFDLEMGKWYFCINTKAYIKVYKEIDAGNKLLGTKDGDLYGWVDRKSNLNLRPITDKERKLLKIMMEIK